MKIGDKVAGDGITLAGKLFQSPSIQNSNVSAAVFDQARFPKSSGGQGDSRTSSPQHLREEFLSDDE